MREYKNERNSLALREGSVVKKRDKKNSLLPFSETQLIEGLNQKLAHADLLAIPLNIEF